MSKERLHMSNEQGDGGGTFSELLRLQTEFQTRLAEETLNYLRRVQGAAAPASPGTVLVPQDGDALVLRGFGERGVAVAIEAKVAGSPPAARKPATAKAPARKTKTRARGTQQRTQRKR